jgi:hypothetical protein
MPPFVLYTQAKNTPAYKHKFTQADSAEIN